MPGLLEDPPFWLVLSLVQYLELPDIARVLRLSSAWTPTLNEREVFWRVVCTRVIANEAPVAVPPELGSARSWRDVAISLVPSMMAWKAVSGCARARELLETQAPPPFTARVVVRLRPYAITDVAPVEPSPEDDVGAENVLKEDAAPPPTEAPPALRTRAAHVPFHQRMALLRSTRDCDSTTARKMVWASAVAQSKGEIAEETMATEATSIQSGAAHVGATEEPKETETMTQGEVAPDIATATAPSVSAPSLPESSTATAAAVLVLPNNALVVMSPRAGLRSFTFDSVLGPDATQEATYASAARSLVFDFLNGSSACVFAYGQTGSGKTFTMSGASPSDAAGVSASPPPVCDVREARRGNSVAPGAGIIPRALSDIFANLDARSAVRAGAGSRARLGSWVLRVSVIEVFGDTVRDLLENGAAVGPSRVTAAAAVASGMSSVPVKSVEEMSALLARAEGKKLRAKTKMNASSSRAHTLLFLALRQTAALAKGGVVSRLVLADLGGSELVSLSGAIHDSARLAEAIMINKSLLALKQVFSARLSAPNGGYAPFADSRLTALLATALGRNGAPSRIAVLIAARSDPAHVVETLQALRFGEDVSHVQSSAARTASFDDGVAASVLSALDERIAVLAGIISRDEVWEKGKPVGAEAEKKEYEALLATKAALRI